MHVFIRFGQAEVSVPRILLKACEVLQIALIAAMGVHGAVRMRLREGKDCAGIIAVRAIAFVQQVHKGQRTQHNQRYSRPLPGVLAQPDYS